MTNIFPQPTISPHVLKPSVCPYLRLRKPAAVSRISENLFGRKMRMDRNGAFYERRMQGAGNENIATSVSRQSDRKH